MRETVLYKETYKKGTTVKKEFLPIMRHSNGRQPAEMHMLALGVIQRGDERYEYQDVRFYFK